MAKAKEKKQIKLEDCIDTTGMLDSTYNEMFVQKLKDCTKSSEYRYVQEFTQRILCSVVTSGSPLSFN